MTVLLLMGVGAVAALLLAGAIVMESHDDGLAQRARYWQQKAGEWQDVAHELERAADEWERAATEERQAAQQWRMDADLWRGVAQTVKRRTAVAEQEPLPDLVTFDGDQPTLMTLTRVLQLPVLRVDPASPYLRRTERN